MHLTRHRRSVLCRRTSGWSASLAAVLAQSSMLNASKLAKKAVEWIAFAVLFLFFSLVLMAA